MSLKSFKPYTKSSRGTILVDRTELWKGKPYKPLTSMNKSSRGRNNAGRITSRNHGKRLQPDSHIYSRDRQDIYSRCRQDIYSST